MFSVNYVNQNETVIFAQDQLNTHKASFRYNDLNIDHESIKKMNFIGKKVLLFVSIGQDYHEKGKFLATIELLNKYSFMQCDIVMADTLQRFNHYGRLGEKDAWIYSKEAGDNWLKRSEYALSKHKIPHSIIRWDSLLNHNDYAELKEQIMKAYHENEEYKLALHTNVMTYIERLKLLNPITDEAELFKNGLGYLLEECPIVMPLWAQMGYDYIIYPKPLTPGMRKTYDLFVKEKFKEKCQWIYLRFKKNN